MQTAWTGRKCFLASTISTAACHLNVYSSSYPKTEKGYHHSKVERNVIIPKATETELPGCQSFMRDSSNYSWQRCHQVDVWFHTRCAHQLSPSLSGQWTTHHGNCPLQPPIERKYWEEAMFSACSFQRNYRHVGDQGIRFSERELEISWALEILHGMKPHSKKNLSNAGFK